MKSTQLVHYTNYINHTPKYNCTSAPNFCCQNMFTNSSFLYGILIIMSIICFRLSFRSIFKFDRITVIVLLFISQFGFQIFRFFCFFHFSCLSLSLWDALMIFAGLTWSGDLSGRGFPRLLCPASVPLGWLSLSLLFVVVSLLCYSLHHYYSNLETVMYRSCFCIGQTSCVYMCQGRQKIKPTKTVDYKSLWNIIILLTKYLITFNTENKQYLKEDEWQLEKNKCF